MLRGRLNKKKCTPVFVRCAFLQQRGVAQIVSHHDGRIQGGEIQGGNRKAVVPAREEGGSGVLYGVKNKDQSDKKKQQKERSQMYRPLLWLDDGGAGVVFSSL